MTHVTRYNPQLTRSTTGYNKPRYRALLFLFRQGRLKESDMFEFKYLSGLAIKEALKGKKRKKSPKKLFY